MSVRPILTKRLDLVAFDPGAIRFLIDGYREAAEQVMHVTLPAEFPTRDDLKGFLPIQLRRMEANPTRCDWMARVMLSRTKQVIGHCGFHGPPDVVGRAEIGYTVFEKWRGKGFAKEAARALVDWAFKQGQQQVFASVSPNNAASLAVVKRLGFTQVGTQEDEVDGLELVFAIEPTSR